MSGVLLRPGVYGSCVPCAGDSKRRLQEVGVVQVVTPGVGTGTCLVAGARLPFTTFFLDCLADGLSGSPRNLPCSVSSFARRSCAARIELRLSVSSHLSSLCSTMSRICLCVLRTRCQWNRGGVTHQGLFDWVDDDRGLQVECPGLGLQLVVRVLWRIRLLVGCVRWRGLVSLVGYLPAPASSATLAPFGGRLGRQRRWEPGLPGDCPRRGWPGSLGREGAAGVQGSWMGCLTGSAMVEFNTKAR